MNPELAINAVDSRDTNPGHASTLLQELRSLQLSKALSSTADRGPDGEYPHNLVRISTLAKHI